VRTASPKGIAESPLQAVHPSIAKHAKEGSMMCRYVLSSLRRGVANRFGLPCHLPHCSSDTEMNGSGELYIESICGLGDALRAQTVGQIVCPLHEGGFSHGIGDALTVAMRADAPRKRESKRRIFRMM
jgi:hypothetical protein